MTQNLQIQRQLGIDEGRITWIKRIQDLRNESASDPPFGLLSLLQDFRFSLASVHRDRLYALRGLLISNHHSNMADVDYGKPENWVWDDFTKQCLSTYAKLNIFALIESDTTGAWTYTSGVLLSRGSTSWSTKVLGKVSFDWQYQSVLQPFKFLSSTGSFARRMLSSIGSFARLMLRLYPGRAQSVRQTPQSVRTPLWGGSELGLARDYSASGNTRARCRTDLPDRDVIGVQGYTADEITATGRPLDSLATHKVVQNWNKLLHHHGVLPTSAMRKKMQWDPLSSDPSNTAMTYLRRLAITRKKRVALVYSNAKPGDLVCVLLGLNVPYALRKSIHDGPSFRHHSWRCFLLPCIRAAHAKCCIRELFTIVGQAYVDGIMDYPGDIERDIEDGLVPLREFLLE